MKRLLTLRSLCSIAIGALICAFPQNMAAALVTCIGILFLLSGLTSLLAHHHSRTNGEPLRVLYPILGIGTALFGILLCIFAAQLGRFVCYLLAVFIVLASLLELISVLRLRSRTHVEAFFWIVPLLVAIAGLLVFLLPDTWLAANNSEEETAAAVRLTIAGVACIVYGVFALLTAVRFRRAKTAPAVKTAHDEDAEVVEFEEVKPDTTSLTPADKEDHARFTPN